MKYILIIGAKNELGLELASLYAKNNYNIYLAGRSINDLQVESNNIEEKYKIDLSPEKEIINSCLKKLA